MPNGGSDNCVTCWFNRANPLRSGSQRPLLADRPLPFCDIREFAISNPAYTYCANHPKHRAVRDRIPIGPVLIPIGLMSTGREISRQSPDTEEIRVHLVELLEAIPEQPNTEYPAGPGIEATIVWQLGEFGESRAIPGLERLTRLDPEAVAPGPFQERRASLIHLAHEALARIRGNET
jgi:hypothetical protein